MSDFRGLPQASAPTSPPPEPQRTSPFLVELPRAAERGMRVPARVFADEELIAQMQRDRSLEQLANVATLPGVVGAVLGMPDMHEGYGFPVGGVAATVLPDGVISPGRDRLRHQLRRAAAAPPSCSASDVAAARRARWCTSSAASIPAGFGRGGPARARRRASSTRCSPRACRCAGARARARAARGPRRSSSRGGCARRRRRRPPSRDRAQASAGAISSARSAAATTSSRCRRSRASTTRRPRRAFGLRRGPGHGADPHRLARPRPPGLHRLRPARWTQALARYGIDAARPPARLRAALLARGPATTSPRCAPRRTSPGRNRQVIAHRVREVFERVLGAAAAASCASSTTWPTTSRSSSATARAELCVHRKGATRAFGPSSAGAARRLPRRRAAGASSPAAWAPPRSCWSAPTRRSERLARAAAATAPAAP